MAETYKRSVFVAPKQIRVDDVVIPEPGPRQALVKVKACAICTWEQRIYTGEDPVYPLSGGHEISGDLVAMGSQVYSDAKIGDRVVASRLTRCGYCESCRRGLDSICDNARRNFSSSDVPGPSGLSEYVLIEDYQLYKGANDVSYEELCLTEPVACVIRSIRKAQLERTDTVVVIGAGIMGLLHVLLAKQAGTKVIVSEPNLKRSEFAKAIGADYIIDPVNESFKDKVLDYSKGRGANAIFTAVSLASAIEQGITALAKGGRLSVYGSIHPRGTKITIDPNDFHGKEITLTGTVSQSREDFLQATRMVADKIVDLKPFISKVLPFEKLAEAIQWALSPDTYRVLVKMD
ncbi:MAG: zinc-binding dehydrogenase [Chloroflexi bacterium]|nr:zinc-binding dehydrogenase [Chloroflexota bacterium]